MKHAEENCSPRPAQPNDLCTCVVTSEVHAVGQDMCGHQAVVTCDCGSWCDCPTCISVCETAQMFFNQTDETTKYVR
jgi:hypothetical protein